MHLVYQSPAICETIFPNQCHYINITQLKKAAEVHVQVYASSVTTADRAV